MRVLREKSMGSSESGGVKNGGAGSIVWVRRRNGSWWPGKILGPDELSSSHLLSPRSGTPVKLLGREDASVDWYNLEKSKRVKAFRCGEFDDCIERAEASFGLPAKKREKYARREDAILHALELEKQFIERKLGKPGRVNSVREHLPDPERKDLVRSSGVLENGNGKLGNHELHQVERTVDISDLIEKKKVPQHISKGKDGTNQGLKEFGSDLSCQMRDFPSLELKQVPVNRMFPPLAASEDSNRLLVDGHVYCVSTAGPCFDNSSDSDSKISFGKRKRPLEGFTEETFPKRRESLRSIVKVRQNYAELHDNLSPDVHRRGLPVDGVHHSMYLPSELHETFVTKQGNQMEMPISRLEMVPCRSQLGGFAADSSGSSEETESDSSETHSLEANVEAGAMLSDAETFIRAHPRMRERLQVQGRHGSASSEESDELPLDNSSRFYFHDQSPATGVSKWQLKGKRNVRSIQKKPIDRFTQVTHPETMGRSMGPGASSHCSSYYHDNGYTNDAGFMEDDFDHHSQGFSKRGYLPSLAQARQNFIGHNMMELEELTWGRPLRGFWEERGVYFNTLYGSTRNGHDLLIDVDLKVQANRQGGEHVPWVSMMSRLNGKAIIGHPIQIETLEEGSTDFQLLTNDMCGTVRYDFDRSKVSPVWNTTKRTTNFRVPHSQVPSSQFHLDGDEDDDNEYVHQSGRVRSKKHLISDSVHKGLPMKKTHSPNFVSKMPSRKADLSSSQKTKALSSIGSDYKFPIKRKGEESSAHIGDVIKALDSGPQTTVACIPVNLVFSRLREAVCRPPSAPAKHGVQ